MCPASTGATTRSSPSSARQARTQAGSTKSARPAAVPPRGTPTLLVPALRAEFVDPAWVAACRTELGDDLVVAPVDAGHMVFLERTADVAAAVRAFL